jgi:hypothetical protein
MRDLLFSSVLMLTAASSLAASSINGIPGLRGTRFTGAAANQMAGTQATVIGDINGDGTADLAVAAPASNANEGAVHVVFGSSNIPATLSLGALNGSNGFTITGTGLAAGAALGLTLSPAGDINGDGVDDVLIGSALSSFSSGSNRSAFVLFGKPTGQSFAASIAINAVNGTNGFSITGESASDFFASALSGGGDVNGDGRDDILIGAPAFQGRGRAYVFFGRASFPANLNANELSAATGVVINTALSGKQLGAAVALGGLINNDPQAEIMVSAPGTSADPGSAFVVYGAASLPAAVNIDSLDGLNGFALIGSAANDQTGAALAFIGDSNGDGAEDMLLGARRHAGLRGAAYVVYGRFAGFEATLALSTLNGSNGYKIEGQMDEALGFDVEQLGDVNADDLFDFALVADQADPAGLSNAGRLYVVYGRAPGVATVDAATLDSAGLGEVFNGAVANRGAMQLGRGGKIDSDALADFVFGVPSANEAYLVRTRGDGLFRNGFE